MDAQLFLPYMYPAKESDFDLSLPGICGGVIILKRYPHVAVQIQLITLPVNVLSYSLCWARPHPPALHFVCWLTPA